MKKIIIFDCDGVLIDTKALIKKTMNFSGKGKIYNFFRKVIILFYLDRISDDRIDGFGNPEILEFIQKNNEYELFIITKRPFVFGAKKRLMKQLARLYGNAFQEENIFSSFFSKNKAAVVKKIPKYDKGFFIDDNENNLCNMPINMKACCINAANIRYDVEKNILFIETFNNLLEAL